MSLAIEVPVRLGLTVGTTNLSPGGDKNTISSVCQNVLGMGNDMWLETGNLMFPWRPIIFIKIIALTILRGTCYLLTMSRSIG